MNKTEKLIGTQIGSLKILSYDLDRWSVDKSRVKNGEIKIAHRYFLCKCLLCNNVKSIQSKHIMYNNQQSCGCDLGSKTSARNKKINLYKLSNDTSFYIGQTTNGVEFYFDKKYYDKVKDICWYMIKGNYVQGKINGKHIYLHQLIYSIENNLNIEDKSKIIIDHINRNPLDNKINNLRVCTQSNNAKNVKLSKRNTTGVIGVTFRKDRDTYRSKVKVDGKTIHLGNFKNIEDAIVARLKGEKEHYGEYAPQKHLFEEYNII